MPIRNLIVLAPSGLVLFEKEYSKEKIAQPRLLGSLLTAMTEFAAPDDGDAAVVHRDVVARGAMCREDSVTAPVHDGRTKRCSRLLTGEILMRSSKSTAGPAENLPEPERFQGLRRKNCGRGPKTGGRVTRWARQHVPHRGHGQGRLPDALLHLQAVQADCIIY